MHYTLMITGIHIIATVLRLVEHSNDFFDSDIFDLPPVATVSQRTGVPKQTPPPISLTPLNT
jgi:hypothetical protein